jgi:putative tryptophan/tyrosine transport system substrate-binding protein
MTYASDLLDGYRRAGIYAAKIIKGAKPGNLPIEQPTKFTLAINTKTAKQLGIRIPAALQVSADELIE